MPIDRFGLNPATTTAAATIAIVIAATITHRSPHP
jgi:hypothetical protein